MKSPVFYIAFLLLWLSFFSAHAQQLLPNDAKKTYWKGVRAFEKGNYLHALKLFERSENIMRHSNPQIQYYRAKAFYETGNWQQSQFEIQRYLGMKSKNFLNNLEMKALFSHIETKQAQAREQKLQMYQKRYTDLTTHPNRYIHLAVRKNDADLVRLLLEHGADPNLDFRGHTPLYYALCRPDVLKTDIARMLLEHGANPNVKVSGAFSLFHAFLNRAYHLPAIDKDYQPYGEAEIRQATELLFAHGLNVNYYKGGALQFAVSIHLRHNNQSALPLIKFLLEKGANPFITDDYNLSPYLLACELGHAELKALFEKHKEQQKIPHSEAFGF